MTFPDASDNLTNMKNTTRQPIFSLNWSELVDAIELTPGFGSDPFRYAVIDRPSRTTLEEVRRYLPSNYRAFQPNNPQTYLPNERPIVIIGRDNGGATMDGYVLRRYGSGGWRAREVTGEDIDDIFQNAED